MIIAGITGGIGSGKTTVCKEWEKKGVKIIYADELARDLMVTNELVRKKLSAAFGNQVYLDDRTLNKPYLIEEAFRKNRVEELNRIVHPAVADEFRSIADRARLDGCEMIVKEAALLLNNSRPAGLDYVAIVLSDKEKRVRRVRERDGVSEEDVLSRMAKQPDFEKLTALADDLIHNNGSLADLKSAANAVYRKWTENKAR